jgi:erythromycin esterase-like protein
MIIVACSQKGKNDYYNLNFQEQFVAGWLDELDMGRLYYDSSSIVDGNIPICIDNENIKKGTRTIRRFTLNYSLGRKVSLPELNDAKEIEITIHYKSLNLEKSSIRIYSANKDGQLLDEYSAEMPETEKWDQVKVTIPDNQIRHLYIGVLITSNDLIKKTSELILEKNMNPNLDSVWMYFPVQKLWINKIQIKAGDFDMVDFSPAMIPKPEIKKNALIPLNVDNGNAFSPIQELKNKKIIGIGESAHTTKEFPKIAYSLIKYRILHDNCKLVVLEIPFSWGLKLNVFVNRETSFGIKEIEETFKLSSISSEEIIDFLLWLKNYNQTAECKVSLVGMSIEQSVLNEDLLSFLNEYIQVDSLLFAPVYQDIFNRKDSEAWDKFLKNRERFVEILGEGETRLLMHGLRHPSPMLKVGAEKKFFLTERDSLMHDKVQIAVSSLLQADETAVVYAHLGHTTKSEVWMPRFVSPVGKYLSDTFGDKYLSIGLITYSEEMDSKQDSKKTDFITFWNTTMAFTPAPSYSLEAACEKTKIPLFYAPTNTLPSTVLLRFCGLDIFKGEFDYYPAKGMDAFIFINRVYKKSIDQATNDRL